MSSQAVQRPGPSGPADHNALYAAALLNSSRRAYAASAAERLLAVAPGSEDRPAVTSFGSLQDEVAVRIDHLAESLSVGLPALFLDHLRWLKVAFHAREVPVELVRQEVVGLRDALETELPDGASAVAVRYLDTALTAYPDMPVELPCLLEGDVPHGDLARRYLLALLEIRRDDALKLVVDAAKGGVPVAEIYEHVISSAQREMGRMWQMAEVNIADEHFGSRIAEFVLAHLQLIGQPDEPVGRRSLLTAVGGNMHDIGLRMVGDLFERGGWDALMLGAYIPAHEVRQAMLDNPVDLLAISVQLPLQASSTAELIQVIRAEDRLNGVPVLVGGEPFARIPGLVGAVGADGAAWSAITAVAAAEELVASGRQG